jgi:hypothetical protein
MERKLKFGVKYCLLPQYLRLYTTLVNAEQEQIWKEAVVT